MEKNSFEQLYEINVSAHVEKKGRFTYLSWPYAVAELRKRHPTATWQVIKHEGIPFLVTGAGVFVEVAVTVDGVTLSQIHPVLNANNKPIYEPNAFEINTSIQRCLVKAIALHGLGLYIYAGEDLPEEEKQEKKGPVITPRNGIEPTPDRLPVMREVYAAAMEKYAAGDVVGAMEEIYSLDDSEELTFVMNNIKDSKARTAIAKARANAMETV